VRRWHTGTRPWRAVRGCEGSVRGLRHWGEAILLRCSAGVWEDETVRRYTTRGWEGLGGLGWCFEFEGMGV